MRRPACKLLVTLLFAASAATQAQAQKPANLEPIPEPPPPPAGISDGAEEPQVTIKKRGEDTVEEHRLNGKLYMVKVTPPHGRPYYLVDDKGTGVFSRRDDLDSGLRVPLWVIKEF
ncbi:MAG: DUF2782 domain-containing protein [Sterolibacteriaceae bacterium]|nr:DUF2782 domain-containing protein [Sterolibacteriaceae bacterium]MBK9087127.1 DUF2782 domain-containing protein [Sterolibacteriaceae bacterium]